MTDINSIIGFPCIRENMHESVFQATHILAKVLQMLERGDSRETILETVEFIRRETKRRNDETTKLPQE